MYLRCCQCQLFSNSLLRRQIYIIEDRLRFKIWNAKLIADKATKSRMNYQVEILAKTIIYQWQAKFVFLRERLWYLV